MKFGNALYEEDIRKAAGAGIPWERLKGRSVLIAGAAGMLGKAMTDVLMYKNENDGLDCRIYASGRNRHRAEQRFGREYFENPHFTFLEWDMADKAPDGLPQMDFLLGMASNTHPLAYAARPIETIITNIYGTKNLLDLCVRQQGGRLVFLSSVEIYGENRGDTQLFDEGYMGFLDCNTLRAGYPESKRCGESLCQAYFREKGTDFITVRLPRLFGPTLLEEDSKAVSQFIHRALRQEDIVLKGHAIECRINAENPEKNFMPCPGTVKDLHFPGGNGVRIESALYNGYTIPSFYDSMVAKVIVHGEDRMDAIRKMRSALGEVVVDGITTNLDFQYDILNHPVFLSGNVNTHFIPEYFE